MSKPLYFPDQEDPKKISIKEGDKVAAGLKGVKVALDHANRYMGKAKAVQTMFKLNQKGGIDCPGCAWPDPDDDRSKLGEYCENGIKAIAEEATKKSIGKEFFQKHSISQLLAWSDFELGKTGRLSTPMLLPKNSDHYVPVQWDEAFSIIANELNTLDDPNGAIFYTSGRTSNEAAFLYQLFVREYGTNNLPDCSNMCHESSGKGLSNTLGIGKGSVRLEDFDEAELIIVMGQNPGTNHPRMLTALEKCKKNGGKIISINPLSETGLNRFAHPQKPLSMMKGGTKLTDVFLQVRTNGDVPLLKAIMIKLLAFELQEPGSTFDLDFIISRTQDYDAFITDLREYDLQSLIRESGVQESVIDEAVELIRKTEKIIICWAMGITQHVNGVDNVQEIVNLLLLKGSIGKSGAGTCPVRGHSNVQGDRTMGIWESPPDSFLKSIEENFGFQPPKDHGYSVVDAIEAMSKEEASVFIAMGGNFVSAAPDTEYTAEALRKCKLTVHVSTKLNRSHLVHGDQALILPCLGRTDMDIQESGEQFVSVENSMGIVHSSKGILESVSDDLLSEPSIVANLAKATLGDESTIDWDAMISNYDHIRDAIEATIPGFDNYNERVRKGEGFYLPNCAREGKFNTPSGKAKFTINSFTDYNLKEDEYLLMTNRSHDQFNTTIYGLDDRYRGVYNGRRVVLMNKDDMEKEGLSKGDKVDIESNYNGKKRGVEAFMVVPYDVSKSCVVCYFPEANPLVPLEHRAHKSKTPASKSVIVTFKRSKV